MPATRAAAEFLASRSDQGFRVTKAWLVLGAWPENEKPFSIVTVATPGCASRCSSTLRTASWVRL